ncbi:hypothetical protein KC19_VG305600 [Ceratodon purpureus]|uniref:Uncharacterized protein n=1 Tax=Ceratodon purpureus TaxID=3225 RepID=A0A8T0HVT7_CERPU|nr:hypothetical protein KC19_VG305600 [Ceratodon purpureus]
MDGWSPRTKVCYGFCQENEEGNIILVWNLAELDEALNGIETSLDEEDVTSVENAGGGSKTRVGVSVVHAVEGSAGAEGVHRGLAADDHGAITDTSDCHHAHRSQLLAQGLQRSEAGDTPVYVPPCPLCE